EPRPLDLAAPKPGQLRPSAIPTTRPPAEAQPLPAVSRPHRPARQGLPEAATSSGAAGGLAVCGGWEAPHATGPPLSAATRLPLRAGWADARGAALGKGAHASWGVLGMAWLLSLSGGGFGVVWWMCGA